MVVRPEEEEAVEVEEEERVEVEEEEEEAEEVEEEAVYKAAPKPKLSEDTIRMLRLRNTMNRKRPRFRRQEWFRYGRLGDSWRAPKGVSSKMRRHFRYRPNVVSVGYRGPKAVRGLHPSGFREVLVYRPEDLDKVDPKTEAVRIGRTVGMKKRLEIMERAKELSKKKGEIRILNPVR